jgi:hypothetical protein
MESDSPRPKKFKDIYAIKQDVGICLLVQNTVLLADYLEKGATITAMCYIALFDKLKQHLVS